MKTILSGFYNYNNNNNNNNKIIVLILMDFLAELIFSLRGPLFGKR